MRLECCWVGMLFGKNMYCPMNPRKQHVGRGKSHQVLVDRLGRVCSAMAMRLWRPAASGSAESTCFSLGAEWGSLRIWEAQSCFDLPAKDIQSFRTTLKSIPDVCLVSSQESPRHGYSICLILNTLFGTQLRCPTVKLDSFVLLSAPHGDPSFFQPKGFHLASQSFKITVPFSQFRVTQAAKT